MSKRWASYLAIFCGGFGSVCTGMTIGSTMSVSKDDAEDITPAIAVYLGACASSIISGKLCDVFGRKTMSLWSVFPLVLGWSLIIFGTRNIACIITGRFISGIACGIVSVSLPMYSTEIAPMDKRGMFGSTYQLGNAIGATMAYAASLVISGMGLQILCVSMTISYICLYYPQLQSPIQQLRNHKEEDARITLQKLRGKNTDISEEFEIFKEYAVESNKLFILYEKLVEVHTKKAMFICCVINIFQQLTGIKLILLKTGNKFDFLPHNPIGNTSYVCILMTIQLLSNILCMVIVDVWGRRALLKTSSLGIFISLVFLGLGNTLHIRNFIEGDTNWDDYMALISLVSFIFTYNIGLGPICYFYPTELSSPEMKGFIMSISCFFNWTTCVCVVLLHHYMKERVKVDVTIFFLCGISFFNICFQYLFTIETTDKNFKQVHEIIDKRKQTVRFSRKK